MNNDKPLTEQDFSRREGHGEHQQRGAEHEPAVCHIWRAAAGTAGEGAAMRLTFAGSVGLFNIAMAFIGIWVGTANHQLIPTNLMTILVGSSICCLITGYECLNVHSRSSPAGALHGQGGDAL
jgi:hypothetical protein